MCHIQLKIAWVTPTFNGGNEWDRAVTGHICFTVLLKNVRKKIRQNRF